MLEKVKSLGGLTRNPLGIIALFIILTDAIAGIVLVQGRADFPKDLLNYLVWFIILFPFITLCLFQYLVTKHHVKLYGPSDFKEDSTFANLTKNASSTEVIDKLISEVEEAENIEAEVIEESKIKTSKEVQKPSMKKTYPPTGPTKINALESLRKAADIEGKAIRHIRDICYPDNYIEYNAAFLNEATPGIFDGLIFERFTNKTTVLKAIVEVKYFNRFSKMFFQSTIRSFKKRATLINSADFFRPDIFLVFVVNSDAALKEAKKAFVDGNNYSLGFDLKILKLSDLKGKPN